MRLALINPCQPYLVEQHTQVPLGLLYLSAVLKRNCPDVQAQLVDASALSVQEAVEEMDEFDVYGFTATSLDYATVLDMREELQQRFPDAVFIVGGPHATGEPEVLEHGWHSVFIGEGEYTIIDFVKDWQISGGVKGMYRGDNTVDLNKLPRPDRDGLSWLGGRVLTTKHKGSINIMASRGCPFNCSFCASRLMWGRAVRWRTPEDVVDEIKECMDRYGTTVFRFSDDNIAGNREWNEKFCELVKPLGITWRLSVRVDSVNPQVLKMMREAGCKELGLGVESFDPKVLKQLNKRIIPEQSVAAIHNAHAAGIGARVLMMLATPGESYKRTVDLNIAALEALKEEFVYLSIKVFKPLPGTPIWLHPEKFGVEIVSRDLSKYNFYIYSTAGKQLWSPLRIDGMTEEEQWENTARMVAYSETLPQNAKG